MEKEDELVVNKNKHLTNWKRKMCDETRREVTSRNCIIVKSQSLHIIHSGKGCEGCPYA